MKRSFRYPHTRPAALVWRILLLAAAAAAMFITPAGRAAAQQDDRVTVRVEGRALFRVGPIDDISARERADLIERRMSNLLENPQAIAASRIETLQSDPTRRVISVAGVPVVTITEEDAQDNFTSVDLLAAQWKTAIDDTLRRGAERRLAPGGRFVAEIRASVEAAFGGLLESAIRVIPRILAALLVILFFWMLAAAVRAAMRLTLQRIIRDRTVDQLIRQVTYYSIWALGIIVAIDAFGFDPQVVLTSLGLTSLALGFALKDILSNFVSGVMILALRPFQLGDQIVIGDTEGTVQRINLRATQIHTYDGRVVQVPNADLFTSRITNNTSSPIRRASVEMPFSYDVDLRQVVNVMQDTMQATQGVLQAPPPIVRVRELGSDSIQVEARFWTDSRRSDFVATTSAVRLNLLQAMQRAGIDLPDPRLRHIQQLNQEAP